MFKRTSLLLISILFILTGCISDPEDGANISKKQFPNEYAENEILILTRSTNYKDQLVNKLTDKLKATYGLTIDDVDRVYDYNFSDYHRVIFIETLAGQTVPKLESYFQNFTGRNNIILVAITNGPFEPKLPVDYIACSPNLDNLPEKSSAINYLIRQK